MNYSKGVWNQVKNKTSGNFKKALEKDGWVLDTKRGSEQVYYHPATERRVLIHFHSKKTTYQPSLLKTILNKIGWTEDEMRALKFIK